MTDFTDALQLAVYAALAAASPAICNGRIYDAVPPSIDASEESFPYVVIGETQDVTDDTDTAAGVSDDGLVTYLTLHVWSRYRGKKEVNDVNAQIRTVLHRAELTVAGRASALCWIDSAQAMDDPDGVTRHGIVTARIVHRT